MDMGTKMGCVGLPVAVVRALFLGKKGAFGRQRMLMRKWRNRRA
jgi:hypothetical protein